MCNRCTERHGAGSGDAQPWPEAASPPRGTAPSPVPRAAGVSGSRNWAGPVARTPGRLFGTGLIRLYQLTLSGFVGNACRHLPTCSEYGYEAIGRHGLWRGGWMTLFRVVRCGPGGTSGFDPVPERLPSRFAWWAPWRLWRLPPEPDRR